MRLNKPKFWNTKNNFISILLFPLSLIVLLFIYVKKKITKVIKFNIPIICVGNIYIGGTGKTPTSIFLAKELLRLGKNPVILRKFYRSHKDEHNLIKKKFTNLILSKNRIDGIRKAEREKYDSVILDDGFQDYKIQKDLSILCFNQNQLVGNGLVLPSGPLRESLSSICSAQIILINGKKNEAFEKKILNINKNLRIFYSSYKPENIDQFKNKKLLAIAGIGNPDNFFQLIEENGLNINKKLVFPDHYEFNKIEIQNIKNEVRDNNYQIIMTEKDYFKIKEFDIDNLEYLKISLEINDKEKFIKTIHNLYDQKN
jgi:tetraacyldisaccharide 4'-kinase